MNEIMKPFWKFFLIGVAGALLCITATILYEFGTYETILDILTFFPFAFMFGFLVFAIFKKKWRIFVAYSIGLLSCVILAMLCQYGYHQFLNKIVYKITPHVDNSSSTGVYVPKNLEECHVEMDSMITDFLRKKMANGLEDDMVKYHFTLGAWMRGSWGLWSGSRLSEYFNRLGINHADDMSGIILDTYWCYLHKCEYDLTDHIVFYKAWEEAGEIRSEMMKKDIEKGLIGKSYSLPDLQSPGSICRCENSPNNANAADCAA